MTVNVEDAARAFHERLELEIQIDDDLVLGVRANSMNLKDEDRREIHNLEFGHRFPADSHCGNFNNDPEEEERLKEGKSLLGALSARANVSNRVDLSLVPGEFLYEYDPYYFDVRLNPPQHQVLEKLYYQPCSLCRRASNDPACKCASILSGTRNHSLSSGSQERQ